MSARPVETGWSRGGRGLPGGGAAAGAPSQPLRREARTRRLACGVTVKKAPDEFYTSFYGPDGRFLARAFRSNGARVKAAGWYSGHSSRDWLGRTLDEAAAWLLEHGTERRW